jgi:hypothetical protein
MTVDLRIQPLGRPKISKDSALGFQRVSRRYVVEGHKVTKDGLDGTFDGTALFLDVGKADEEFENHFLVNQHVEPGKTVDKAYLTRDYAEIRNTWSAESASESGDLKRITRRYAVLRNESALGYSADSWLNHPSKQPVSSDSLDPWDYLPQVVVDTSPVAVSYGDTGGVPVTTAGIAQNSNPFAPLDINIGVELLWTAIANSVIAGTSILEWVPATAQVDMSNPGVDMWSVSWVAPVSPSWSTANLPSTVNFSEQGIKMFKFGQSANGPQTAHAFTYYTVGESMPPYLLPFASSGGRTPSVSMDFYLVGLHGNHGSQSFKQTLTNTIYDKDGLQANLKFPSHTGGGAATDIQIANGNIASGEYIFDYPQAAPPPNTMPPGGYPMYQRNPIIKSGGHITWTQGYTTGETSMAKVSIKPIFSHNLKKIWKVTLVYVS